MSAAPPMDTLAAWHGPAQLEQLPAVVAALERAAAEAGASDEVLLDLRLAVEEACVNVMRHAYPPGTPGAPWLDLQVQRAQWQGAPALRLQVRDGGRPFNPLAVAAPDVAASAEERAIGGLGIHLIRSVTDAQQYVAEPAGGNCLVLFKTLAPPAPTP